MQRWPWSERAKTRRVSGYAHSPRLVSHLDVTRSSRGHLWKQPVSLRLAEPTMGGDVNVMSPTTDTIAHDTTLVGGRGMYDTELFDASDRWKKRTFHSPFGDWSTHKINSDDSHQRAQRWLLNVTSSSLQPFWRGTQFTNQRILQKNGISNSTTHAVISPTFLSSLLLFLLVGILLGSSYPHSCLLSFPLCHGFNCLRFALIV